MKQTTVKPAAFEERMPSAPKAALEVENTLPLIAATDEKRVGLAPEPFKSPRPPLPLGLPHRNLLAIAAAVIVLAGSLAFFTRGRWLPSVKPGAPSTAAGSPLQMEVGSEGNGLVDIRWNPQSEAVAHARDGRLTITEGEQPPRILALEPEQLRIGHLSYQPSAERLEFRLEVVNSAGGVTQESVLALSPVTPPKPVPEAIVVPPSLTAREQTAPVAPVNVVAPPVAPPQPIRSAIRSFQPPSAQPNTTARSAILLDPPAPVPVGSVIAPGAGLAPAVSSIPAPPVKEVPPARQITVGGNIQAANLVKKVTPVYPPMAVRARIQGTVRFSAVIGRDGTIQNLQAVSGPSTLVQAATDAVKQWVYRPTLLNGLPVEVITQIDVNFTLSR